MEAASREKSDSAWAEQCRRNLERDTMTHIKYGFAHVYRPVLDDAPYRVFDSMQQYREWCHQHLPRYLGFQLARHAGKQIPTATGR
jgi:hypothetical protein